MLTLDQIKDIIPHRDPFLWIDSVAEMSATKIVAVKALATDLELFKGHYPDFPVLPGVIQCEAIFQAGAILIAQTAKPDPEKVPVVTRQNNTKFRRMIRPGEVMDIEVELTETVSNAFFLKGKTSVGGQVATRLEFACALAPINT